MRHDGTGRQRDKDKTRGGERKRARDGETERGRDNVKYLGVTGLKGLCACKDKMSIFFNPTPPCLIFLPAVESVCGENDPNIK